MTGQVVRTGIRITSLPMFVKRGNYLVPVTFRVNSTQKIGSESSTIIEPEPIFVVHVIS